MEGFSSGEILGLELDVMPQIEDELLEIDNLANLIAEGHFVLFLGKDVNAEMSDHHTVNLEFVDCLIHDLQLRDEVLVAFPVDRSRCVDEDAHRGAGEVVAST